MVCPRCIADLELNAVEENGTDVINGSLACGACDGEYKIVNSIPRFVPPESYAKSFGIQWNAFKTEQLDSKNGFTISNDRFFSVTEWDKEWMEGKLILDAGCGAGRFLDISSKYAGDVVGIDLSNAVDASLANLKERENLLLVQASIYEMPFRPGTFDGAYCIGVIQHTPEPKRTIRSVAEMVKKGGHFAMFIYNRQKWTKYYSKYLLRPLTTKLRPETLLRMIKISMPVLFPLTEILFRIPVLDRYFMFMVPVSNYVGVNVGTAPKLDWKQRYQWAIMDTFDMFAPAYDEPQTFDEVKETLIESGMSNIRRTSPIGLCLDGEKTA